MDEYLNLNKSFNRLKEEYFKYGSLVIAYDFDNTVYDFHKTGATYNNVIKLLQELKAVGCTCICFTANEDEEFVRNYCSVMQIPLDGFNENPKFFSSDSRKIYFNILLDDRAGLHQTYTELKSLLNYIKMTKHYDTNTEK